MRINDTSTPVVILRSINHGALGISRSLGRLGVSVAIVDPDPHNPGFSSRYCRKKLLWDVDHEPREKSVAYLLGLGRKTGRKSLLIPTTDEAAIFVADHADALKEWFLFPDQPSKLVRSLASKKEMYYLAKKFGIPTPEAAFPQSKREVLNFLDGAVFPIMLKGIDGLRLWKRAGKRMFIVQTEPELLEKYDAFEDPEEPNLMLQEYIPGGDDTVWMFNGYFDEHSDCVFGLTGKKIRQCPVYRGVTSLGVCLRNEVVENLTRQFMKALGYKGVLDIGYRYDARDGRYKVLDVNPRIGGSFRLFVANNGLDVARALYLGLTAQPLVAGAAREGRRWIVEDLDLVSCFRYYRDGKLTFQHWITSFRGIEEAAYFALGDPLPVWPMCLKNARELFRRLYRKVRRKLPRPSAASAKFACVPACLLAALAGLKVVSCA